MQKHPINAFLLQKHSPAQRGQGETEAASRTEPQVQLAPLINAAHPGRGAGVPAVEGGSRLIHHTAGSKLGGSEGSPKRGGGSPCAFGGDTGMFHGGLHPARLCSCWGRSGGVPERSPHTSRSPGGGRGAQPGAGTAGALQPAWPSLLQPGFAHESRLFTRAEATGCHQRRPHAGVTRADPRPSPRRMAGGDEKRHLLSEGPAGYGGAGGARGCRAPSLLCGSRVGSGRGKGWGGAFRVPQNRASPKHRLCPAGPTWGLRGRTGTTRHSRDRSQPWSWGHGVASTATRGGTAATPAGSSGRAGSSTWPRASASSSWWGKPWVSAGCGVCWGVPVGSPRGAAQGPSCPGSLLWVWPELLVVFLWVKTPGGTPLWHGLS